MEAKSPDRIKQARISRGLSQRAVGQHIGVAQASISQLESGKRNISPDELKTLANVFGVTEKYLLGPKVNEKPKPVAKRKTNLGVYVDSRRRELGLRPVMVEDKTGGTISYMLQKAIAAGKLDEPLSRKQIGKLADVLRTDVARIDRLMALDLG